MNHFFAGFNLITQPGLRRFVIVPLLINIILFVIALIALISQLDHITDWAYSLLPSWLSWLSYLVSPLIIIATFMVFSFIFTAVANFIAAPFNGILAEKTEHLLTGKSPDYQTTFSSEVTRTLKREWQKLMYVLPKSIGFLILFWLVPIFGQVIWFLFSAWIMAIQYCDYPFDNHKVEFGDMKDTLWQHKGSAFSFGGTVVLFSMVPFINLLVMPVAVCGATKLWVEEINN
ncbi:sulfate transporter CysZ [Algibacillus agarilyticus]|uniref:sulfate transporter CysZ n=1 Tax=Algibacillus agarilyticus TaxID=2234133 RepID=UPI000DCFCB6D|nr:sulfate transporter CysZ [Algibacillus agarilyticus]